MKVKPCPYTITPMDLHMGLKKLGPNPPFCHLCFECIIRRENRDNAHALPWLFLVHRFPNDVRNICSFFLKKKNLLGDDMITNLILIFFNSQSTFIAIYFSFILWDLSYFDLNNYKILV